MDKVIELNEYLEQISKKIFYVNVLEEYLKQYNSIAYQIIQINNLLIRAFDIQFDMDLFFEMILSFDDRFYLGEMLFNKIYFKNKCFLISYANEHIVVIKYETFIKYNIQNTYISHDLIINDDDKPVQHQNDHPTDNFDVLAFYNYDRNHNYKPVQHYFNRNQYRWILRNFIYKK